MISGKTIGCIQVQAPRVVIRNSKISCNGLAVATFDGEYSGTPLLIEDTEIDCQNAPGSHGIGDANVTVRRVEITACENGLDINQNIIVEDSYIHNLYNGGDSHMDGLQLAGHWNGSSFVDGALNVTIRHNTIYGMGDGDTTFGTSAIFTIRPGNTNILIERQPPRRRRLHDLLPARQQGHQLPRPQQPIQPQVQGDRRVLRLRHGLLRRDPVRQRHTRNREAPEAGVSARHGRRSWYGRVTTTSDLDVHAVARPWFSVQPRSGARRRRP